MLLTSFENPYILIRSASPVTQPLSLSIPHRVEIGVSDVEVIRQDVQRLGSIDLVCTELSVFIAATVASHTSSHLQNTHFETKTYQ